MRFLLTTALLIFFPGLTPAGDIGLETVLLRTSQLYDKARVEAEVSQRIQDGVYDGYVAKLCVDDPTQCSADVFKPYKRADSEKTTLYSLKIQQSDWNKLPPAVKDAAVQEILYHTWGHTKRAFSPVDVVMKGDVFGASPLAHLSPDSARRYLRFAKPEMLIGGRGVNAYGPNCWYNAISSISDRSTAFAQAQMLVPATWERARFMGPTEFRLHMQQFTQVKEPRFGDIIRYYTDDPIYGGFKNLVFGGEVHAAVYVGKETTTTPDGATVVREIALTKNGRSDLDFLVFQDVQGMDALYLAPPTKDGAKPGLGTVIKRGYFRVNRGASLLDPTTTGKLSGAYDGYLVDNKNYADRWLCLAELADPPPGEGKSCYSYPVEWMTLPSQQKSETQPKSTEFQKAPLLKPVAPMKPNALTNEKASG